MKRITMNFLYMFAGDGVTRIIGFFATVYIARVLAVEGFGLISYGLAFTSYALLFANPGLTIIGAREVAKEPGDRRFIEETLGLRLILALVMFALLAAGAWFVPGDPVTRRVVIVYGLALFPFAVLLEFVFQGREEMAYIGWGRVIQYAVYLAILLLFLKCAAQILVVPLAFVIGYAASAVFLVSVFLLRHGSLRPRFSIRRWRAILVASIPVGLAVILNQVTISLPAIVLGAFRTNYDVGIFSAGYKIVFTLLVIERVFYYVFFPVLARQHKENPEKLPGSFAFLTRSLYALTIPLAAGGAMLASSIITAIYGPAFAEAAGVLRLLLLYFMIVPVNTVFGYGLIALGREKMFSRIIGLTALLSAALILLLGARLGAHGAAAALLASESACIILMARELKRHVRFNPAHHIARPLIAAACMIAVLIVLRPWSLAGLVCAGAAVYGVVLFLVRGLSRQDMANLRHVLRRN